MVASVVAVGLVVVSMTVGQVSMSVSHARAIVVVRVGFSISSSFSFRGSLGLSSSLS